jgi:O-antigen ligase
MQAYLFWRNNQGLIISLIILLILLPIAILIHGSLDGYAETYIYYFMIASFLIPIAPFSLTKNWKLAVFQSVIFVLVVILFTYAYWFYRDKAYLPQRFDCDGPCYGWFSFENEINNYLLLLAGGAGLILGGIIRMIKNKSV